MWAVELHGGIIDARFIKLFKRTRMSLDFTTRQEESERRPANIFQGCCWLAPFFFSKGGFNARRGAITERELMVLN